MTARAYGLLSLLFVLLLGSGFSRAETIAATINPYSTSYTEWQPSTHTYPTGKQSTPQAACNIVAAVFNVSGGLTAQKLSAGEYRCKSGSNDYGYAQKICPISGYGFLYSGSPVVDDPASCYKAGTSYSCPSTGGWTLNGSSCTRPDCVAPQTRNASSGACEIACPSAGSNAMIGGAQAWGISGSSGTCTSGISFSGCKITCTSGVSASGKASCTGCTFTGAASTSADAAADPTTGEEIKAPTKPEECLAKGQGYVTTSSGTTCVAQDQASEPISTKTTETTTTKNGSGVTTGTEETTVECIGDKCTTTSTTKDGAGVTTGTTTSTGTGDKSGTDPTEDKQSECDKHPETVGCSQYGTPTEDGPLTTNAVGTSSLSPALSAAGTCPADINLPKGMKFSWEYPCMYANGIRPVVIALAWLSAGFLLFGMRLD